VNHDGELHKDVFEGQLGFLQAMASQLGPLALSCATYVSVVNLPSLNAAMKVDVSRKARRHKVPCELRLTSWTSATVRSLSFW
jgi:hypothetical protein